MGGGFQSGGRYAHGVPMGHLVKVAAAADHGFDVLAGVNVAADVG